MAVALQKSLLADFDLASVTRLSGPSIDLVRGALDDDQIVNRQRRGLFIEETEAPFEMAERHANPELTLFIEFVRQYGIEFSVVAGHWHLNGDVGTVPAGLLALAKEFIDDSGSDKECSAVEHPKFIQWTVELWKELMADQRVDEANRATLELLVGIVDRLSPTLPMPVQIAAAEAPQDQAGLPRAVLDADPTSWTNGRRDLDFTRFQFKNNSSSAAENFYAMLKDGSPAWSETCLAVV